MRTLLFLLSVAVAITAAAQQTTVSAQTSNNTAACSAAGSPAYCQAGFTGMSDSTSGAFNPAPSNVSNIDIHTLLYGGNTTLVFGHVMPWFCMNAGSTTTGAGTLCQSHVQVGYNSNDANTVNGQAQDMIRRGLNGAVLDWYGPTLGFYDGVAQKYRDNLNARCLGPQSCPLLLALMEDQGSFEWSGGKNGKGCPQNGGGVDQTNCILSKLKSDMDYMNANYFGTNSYLKIDNTPGSPTYMQATPTGKPVVLFFICEECWTNPTPRWTTIWNSLRTYTNSYSSGTPAMFFIFRNSPAFSHVQTNGGYAWVNWDNSNGTDFYGLNYLTSFYNTATTAVYSNPRLLTFGAGWKGFDETLAPWVTSNPRTMGQQCGQTWLQTIQKANSYYSGLSQLPFLGLVTWNDYEEGTEIETGIDNCLSLTASLSGSVLSWTPTFSSSSGSENTVSGYALYSSTDGTNLTKLTTVAPGTRSIDLSTFALANGSYTIYVQAVGQPSITNKMSDPVSYAVGSVASDFSVSASPSTVSLVQGTSGSATITSTISGSFNSSVSLSASGMPAGVTVGFSPASIAAPGSGSSTMTITASSTATIGSATITVTATGGGKTHTTTVNLTVGVAPDFSLAASPTTLSMVQGGSSPVTVTSTITGTFNSAISLSASGMPTGVTVGFSPTSIAAPGSGSSTMTISASTTATTGPATITITGTGGGKTHTTALSLTVTSTGGGGTSINAAAQANGGVASASSTYSIFYPVTAVNDGDRKGLNWGNGGGWNDATTGVYPDWVQINFNGVQTIGEVDVFTIQDNYAAPVDPTPTMTFTLYGITAFEVQYWNGSSWVDVPGGNVSGNNLVWRQFTFSAISTDRIRVLVNNALASYSRITEIEAWTTTGGGGPTPTVTLTSPANNTTLTAPATVNLSATASESGGTISKVEFYRNATLVATATTGNGGVYTGSDTGVPVGTYSYTAKAYDANNVTTTSAAASVTVNSGTSINAAAQANGGVASASSTYSIFYPVTAVNDGDRKGLNWGNGGGWNDATTGVYPDWVQINFNGVQTIGEIDVFTLQDNFGAPVDPTLAMTFTLYGITAFEVQYWNGSSWVDVPGGNVSGNNLVWRQFVFSAISTDRIRVLVNNALASYSRITEIEAWTQ